MQIHYLSFFALSFLSCGSPENQNDLTSYLKEELKEMKIENEKLKVENKGQANKIEALEKEIDQLKRRNAQTVSVNNPKPEQKNRMSQVRPADLAGQWKARLVFKERTLDKDYCGQPNDVLIEDWDISVTAAGVVNIRIQQDGYGREFGGIALQDNRLMTPGLSLFVANKNKMKGERTVKKSRNCSVTYHVTLTRR